MRRRKRIVITGGAGFLGSHLCERLLNDGHEIYCVDNLFTGSGKNIAPHIHNPYFHFICHDVTEPLYIEAEEIYHLACPASPVYYQLDPIKTIETNVIGSLNLLELAKQTQAKILLASTSEVYGNPLIHPQTETYCGNVNITGPRACYDEGKRCAETLFFDYHRQYGVDIRVIRIFNTYGPRMNVNDGRVISNFIVQALQNEEITVYGEGNQTRSFCYVDDLIEGMLRMMNNSADFLGPVNLGNPIELPIKDVALVITGMIGSQSKITYLPLPENDPIRRQPDITLAQQMLGWKPGVSFELGLSRTIEYFKDALKEGENIEDS